MTLLDTNSSPELSLVRKARGRLVCALGPTNTGKTHLAIERMLGHSSGMIGLPLRLLAREVYDRIVPRAGKGNVALITGEEKIVPRNPSYYVCTVESMPLTRDVAFLAVDEIQLCGDPDRGHVFTDRLLRARGQQETMFMGAATIEPILKRLLPDAEFMRRNRFSKLSYTGPKNLKQLPRRAAVIAFTSDEVYRLAELLRRQRGGAAVVLGALSPRTRNAQVRLYQEGQVDYLVATDAIGMGLNMDIDHVAFASLRKFDGMEYRALTTQEIAQIAGRAGRHMNDGTFGTLSSGHDPLTIESDSVAAIEGHQFSRLQKIYWRNARLEYKSLRALIGSLETPAPSDLFIRKADADDLQVLRMLADDPMIRDVAAAPAAVARLWQACQIPDFRKVLPDVHARLVRQIYRHLMSSDGFIPESWLIRQIEPLDRTDGDIDTLSARIAHIRTWTYVANQPDWLADPSSWRERTRAIEDRLSDALHAGLAQRFVDARTTMLMRELRKKENIYASVSTDGDVQVEGHYIGQLKGLRFIRDGAGGSDDKILMHAAARTLRYELSRRIRDLDENVAFELRGADVLWQGEKIARLVPGHDILSPRIELKANELIDPASQSRLQTLLECWLGMQLGEKLAPLIELRRAIENRASGLSAPARGLIFQLVESLGSLPRRSVASLARDISRPERGRLRRMGIRFGQSAIFMPDLLKPAAAGWAATLWSVFHREWPDTGSPRPGQVGLPVPQKAPRDWYRAWGYRVIGHWAVRLDMLEKIAWAMRQCVKDRTPADPARWQAWAGCNSGTLKMIANALGYRLVDEQEAGGVFVRRARHGKRKRTGRARRK